MQTRAQEMETRAEKAEEEKQEVLKRAEQEKRNIILNLLSLNMSIEHLSSITGVSWDDIQKIRDTSI